MNRRSTYSPAGNASIVVDLTPTSQRSFQAFDHLSYLTIVENSQTLIISTYLLLLIDVLVYMPYWLAELTSFAWTYQLKDLYLLSHILKPFCYIATNEKYRFHMRAVLLCKPFRKTRVVTLNNDH
jgi:hypothetical protein